MMTDFGKNHNHDTTTTWRKTISQRPWESHWTHADADGEEGMECNLKNQHTEMIFVNVPDEKKMNATSPIDQDPGAIIGKRLETLTPEYVEGDD